MRALPLAVHDAPHAFVISRQECVYSPSGHVLSTPPIVVEDENSALFQLSEGQHAVFEHVFRLVVAVYVDEVKGLVLGAVEGCVSMCLIYTCRLNHRTKDIHPTRSRERNSGSAATHTPHMTQTTHWARTCRPGSCSCE